MNDVAWTLLVSYVITSGVAYRINSKNAKNYCLAKGLPDKTDRFFLIMSLLPIVNWVGFPVYLDLKSTADKAIQTVGREVNAIGKCPNCERYSRKYQSVLHKLDASINGKTVGCCPHCEEGIFIHYSVINSDEHAWQANHSDCPKLSKRGLVEYLKTRRDIEAIVTQMESFEALERYEKTRRKRNEQR